MKAAEPYEVVALAGELTCHVRELPAEVFEMLYLNLKDEAARRRREARKAA